MIPVLASCAIVAIAALYGHYYSQPRVTVEESRSDPELHGSLISICHLHHRLATTHPERAGKSLFEHLGINANTPPFSNQDWLNPSEAASTNANDIIVRAWAERQERLRSDRFREGQGLLSAVAEMMTDHKIMAVYMRVIMPQLGQSDQLGAMKRICKDEWREEK